MNCPKCHSSTRVKGSREQSGLGAKRRRTCPDCGFDFLTISDSTHGEKYLGPAPKYTPEQKAEIGDRYIRLVKSTTSG
jgi:transposase-like protein